MKPTRFILKEKINDISVIIILQHYKLYTQMCIQNDVRTQKTFHLNVRACWCNMFLMLREMNLLVLTLWLIWFTQASWLNFIGRTLKGKRIICCEITTQTPLNWIAKNICDVRATYFSYLRGERFRDVSRYGCQNVPVYLINHDDVYFEPFSRRKNTGVKINVTCRYKLQKKIAVDKSGCLYCTKINRRLVGISFF
jgi:hypothetical protein